MKNIITSILLITSPVIFSQIPNGYYQNAYGLNGDDLRLALYNIIKNHNSQSYSSLWGHFNSTDKQQSNNYIWDMYSDNPNGANPYNYVYNTDKCGNYNSEGDCYNREHSMPKSWFNNVAPLYTDLFHIYPTDGYVNNKRGNYSLGEVGTVTWTSNNGSKVGICNYPGYSSTFTNPKVFEPIDEYKGDFARSYFYMLTRYRFHKFYNNNANNNDMVVGNGGVDVTQFTNWAENMLTEWAVNDPVSQKEIDRNNKVYQIQGNRNPYIDHPEFAAMVFGPLAGVENKKIISKVWYNNNKLNITSNIKDKTNIIIYNMLGKQVLTKTIESRNNSLYINLPKGMYILSIEKDFTNTLKFIVY